MAKMKQTVKVKTTYYVKKSSNKGGISTTYKTCPTCGGSGKVKK